MTRFPIVKSVQMGATFWIGSKRRMKHSVKGLGAWARPRLFNSAIGIKWVLTYNTSCMYLGEKMNYLEKRYQKNESIVSREVVDEYILVPIQQDYATLESIYILNEMSNFIWQQIDGRRQVKDLKEAIIEEYEVEPCKAEEDLIEFLQQLEAMSVVTPIE